MSYLKNTRGYLSGCIEYDKHEKNWRNEPKRVLIERFKINLFDPFDDPKQQWVTHLKKARDEKNYDEMARNTPIPRVGNPEDVADVVLGIIESKYMTGQNVIVDGGRGLN